MLKNLLKNRKERRNQKELQKIKIRYWWKFEGFCICKQPFTCCPRCCLNHGTLECEICTADYYRNGYKQMTYFKPVKPVKEVQA
jgi:hypothetical protein